MWLKGAWHGSWKRWKEGEVLEKKLLKYFRLRASRFALQAMEEAKVTEVEIDEVRRQLGNSETPRRPLGDWSLSLDLQALVQVLQGLRGHACL